MNWGHKLTIGMVLFMIFIVVLVVMMMRTNVDLVTDRYYETGIEYQQKINSDANAQKIISSVNIQYLANELVIDLPQIDSGTVLIYCPSDNKKDFSERLNSSTTRIKIPKSIKNKIIAKLKWVSNGQNYTYEKEIKL